MIAAVVGLVIVYIWSVAYRASLLMVPKFCHDVRRCRRKHRVVFVAPPNKPSRAVLKHV